MTPKPSDCGESKGSCTNISKIRSVKIGQVISTTPSQPQSEAIMEIDNNADTAVLHSLCLVIHDLNRLVDVSGYDPTSGSQECATITEATAYYQLVTGQTYMLGWNQAIHCKNLTNQLLCPMHSKIQVVKINDLPKLLCMNIDNETHAIVSEYPLYSGKKLIILLS